MEKITLATSSDKLKVHRQSLITALMEMLKRRRLERNHLKIRRTVMKIRDAGKRIRGTGDNISGNI